MSLPTTFRRAPAVRTRGIWRPHHLRRRPKMGVRPPVLRLVRPRLRMPTLPLARPLATTLPSVHPVVPYPRQHTVLDGRRALTAGQGCRLGAEHAAHIRAQRRMARRPSARLENMRAGIEPSVQEETRAESESCPFASVFGRNFRTGCNAAASGLRHVVAILSRRPCAFDILVCIAPSQTNMGLVPMRTTEHAFQRMTQHHAKVVEALRRVTTQLHWASVSPARVRAQRSEAY